MVSQLRVTQRRVRLGDQVGLLGGIGDVATHPSYRNRGYASACLTEATRFMREAGCCLSALVTGPGRFSFYGRLGWEVAVPDYRVQMSAAAAPAAALEGYSRRRFDLERDLPAVMQLYEAHNAGRLLSVARSEDYWRRQLAFTMTERVEGPWGYLKEDPEGFIVITDSSRLPVAYARSRRGEERHEVTEAAASDRQAACALLAHLAEQYRHRRDIVLNEPPDSVLGEVALTPCRAQITVSSSGTMVRIIDLRLLFELLAPTFTARLRRSELVETSGALRLETEIGSVTMEWDRGEVAPSRARKAWRLALPVRALTQVVAGYRSVVAVLEEMGRLGELAPTQARAVEVLFPRCYPHVHAADRF
jgi:predicted acetyltransferase